MFEIQYPNIRTPKDLGVAIIGAPYTGIVPPKRNIDREDYGRKVAAMDGGVFTLSGYLVPIKDRRTKDNAK